MCEAYWWRVCYQWGLLRLVTLSSMRSRNICKFHNTKFTFIFACIVPSHLERPTWQSLGLLYKRHRTLVSHYMNDGLLKYIFFFLQLILNRLKIWLFDRILNWQIVSRVVAMLGGQWQMGEFNLINSEGMSGYAANF